MPPRLQPDPALGIFETMLVLGGVPVAPSEHLARLQASLEAIYERDLPEEAEAIVAEHARGLQLGRLRLTYASSRLQVEAGEIDPAIHFPRPPVSLRSHRVSGGLGHHKWADRTALPTGSAREAALLVDGEEALEADRANLFAVRRGALFTPPLDGRILPGVTRATTIALTRREGFEVSEVSLDRQGLDEADEIFLTNSVRGIEAVGSVDEVRLPDDRPLTRQLARALRDEWQSEAAARRRPLRTSV